MSPRRNKNRYLKRKCWSFSRKIYNIKQNHKLNKKNKNNYFVVLLVDKTI